MCSIEAEFLMFPKQLPFHLKNLSEFLKVVLDLDRQSKDKLSPNGNQHNKYSEIFSSKSTNSDQSDQASTSSVEEQLDEFPNDLTKQKPLTWLSDQFWKVYLSPITKHEDRNPRQIDGEKKSDSPRREKKVPLKSFSKCDNKRLQNANREYQDPTFEEGCFRPKRIKQIISEPPNQLGFNDKTQGEVFSTEKLNPNELQFDLNNEQSDSSSVDLDLEMSEIPSERDFFDELDLIVVQIDHEEVCPLLGY